MKGFRGNQGFTLLELVAALGLLAVLSYVAVNKLKELDNPLKNSAAELEGFIKQVRARAISTTSAYTIQAVSSQFIRTTYADSCVDTTQTTDWSLTLRLPNGAKLSDTSWSICFAPRGLPDSNVVIDLEDTGGETRSLEVYLGGAVKQLDV